MRPFWVVHRRSWGFGTGGTETLSWVGVVTSPKLFKPSDAAKGGFNKGFWKKWVSFLEVPKLAGAQQGMRE